MKSKNLKEYFGTQRPSFAGGPGAGSNFYSGADLGAHTKGRLGTRGADSKFSQRMQAIVPNDYYDLLEEDDEEIDEDYVVENSKYSLRNILEAEGQRSKRTPTEAVWWESKINSSISKFLDKETKIKAKKALDTFKTQQRARGNDITPESLITFITNIMSDTSLLTESEKMLFSRSLFDSFPAQNKNEFERIILKFAGSVRGNDRINLGDGQIFPAINFETPDLDQKKLVDLFFKSADIVDRSSFESELEKSIGPDQESDYNLNPAKYVLSHWAKTQDRSTLPNKIFILLKNYYNQHGPVYNKISIDGNLVSSLFIRKQTQDLIKVIDEINRNLTLNPISTASPIIDSPEPESAPEPGASDPLDPIESIASTNLETSSPDSKESSNKSDKVKDSDLPIEEYAQFKRDTKDYAIEVGTEVFLRDAASLLFGLGDEAVGVLRIIYNLFFQIRRTNNQVLDQKEIVESYFEKLKTLDLTKDSVRRFHMTAVKEQIVKLQKLQQDILRDITDLIQGVIALIPDDQLGPIAGLETSLGKLSENLPKIVGKYLDTLKADDTTQIEMLIKKDSSFKPIRDAMVFLSAIKFLSNFSNFPLSLLSFLNVNIFNPIGIFVMGIQSLFITAELQKKLIIAHNHLENNRIEYLSSSVPQSDVEITPVKNIINTDTNINMNTQRSASDKYKSIARKLFYSRPGDTTILQDLFSESLEKRTLVYLIEDYEIVDEDIDAEENDLDEFSGVGAVAGFSLPLGTSPRGKNGVHSSTSGGEIFPYTKSDRKKFKKFSKKTLGAIYEQSRYS